MKKELVTPLKEKLISFETAELAKEKGFDIPTLYGCNHKGELQEYITYESYSPGEPEVRINDFIRKWEYQLPTQSLLQKWIREVHDVSIKIDDYYTNGGLRFDYNVCELGSQEDNPVGIFETYEEALEIGLQEALKLIKS